MSRAGAQKPKSTPEVGSALALHLLFSFRPCSVHALPFSLRSPAGVWVALLPALGGAAGQGHPGTPRLAAVICFPGGRNT